VTARGEGQVRLCALGDLMLSGEWDRGEPWTTTSHPFRDLAELLSGELVLANLETTILGTDGHIPKAPRLFARPETVRSGLAALGVDIANLANNHAFDGYLAGFGAVREILAERKIRSFGAGRNASEAAEPCATETNGIRFGWLGYVSPDTVLSHVATSDGFGVNLLSEDRVLADIAALGPRVDHVIVSLHWGVEFCHLPSPAQIRFARELIDRGATLVIGHHAHVVQGVERHGNGLIAYNLGNVTTTDHYIEGRLAIRQTPRTRSSFVLRVVFTRQDLVEFDTVPIRSLDGHVLVNDGVAGRYLEHANNQLRRGISDRKWRWRRIYEDVGLRTLRKLHPAVIGSLRMKHLAMPFRNISRAIRGRGPA
jgi:poly-gamma-glutamate synthesis protein (capsule biosynthesis protein)